MFNETTAPHDDADDGSHDEGGSQYPFQVRQAGPRAMQFYDQLYAELTTGTDAVQPDVAEFMIAADWPEISAQLTHEAHGETAETTTQE